MKIHQTDVNSPVKQCIAETTTLFRLHGVSSRNERVKLEKRTGINDT